MWRVSRARRGKSSLWDWTARQPGSAAVGRDHRPDSHRDCRCSVLPQSQNHKALYLRKASQRMASQLRAFAEPLSGQQEVLPQRIPGPTLELRNGERSLMPPWNHLVLQLQRIANDRSANQPVKELHEWQSNRRNLRQGQPWAEAPLEYLRWKARARSAGLRP